MHVAASTLIRAPRDQVFALYADYAHWPTLFPVTIRGVRLVRDGDDATVLEIDHVEGRVPNTLRLRPPDRIEVDEDKRLYTGTLVNTFEAVPDGTRYTVAANIHLRGWYKLATPFVGGYVRRQLVRLVLEPMRQSAEKAR